MQYKFVNLLNYYVWILMTLLFQYYLNFSVLFKKLK